jgi:hypothetical protein
LKSGHGYVPQVESGDYESGDLPCRREAYGPHRASLII